MGVISPLSTLTFQLHSFGGVGLGALCILLSTVPRAPQGTGETPRNQSLSSGTPEGSRSIGKKRPGGMPHQKPSLVLRDPKRCAQPPCPLLGSAPIEGLAGVCPCCWSGGSGSEALGLFHLLLHPHAGGLAIHSSLRRRLLKEPTHHLPVPRDLESFLQLLRTPRLEWGIEGPWKNLTPQLQGETPPHLFCHQMNGVRFYLFRRGDAMGYLSQLRGPGDL